MKKSLVLIVLITLVLSCAQRPKESTPPKNVKFEEQGKQYQAELLLPVDKDEKVPLVVVVHEWWGRTPYIRSRAHMLTDEGYAALAVDLYGNGKTVQTPKEAQVLATPFYKDPTRSVKLIQKYIAEAKKDPRIDADEIYVIGYCFGGTQALNVARSGAEIEGVVSFHGGLSSTYPTKEIEADVLVLHGEADPMVPPKDVAAFEKEMQKADADYRLVRYEGATHAFTNPKATEIGKKYNIPIAYNKKADEASWQELMKFLGN